MLQELLKQTDDARELWRQRHPIAPDLLAVLQEKLRALWTYHSNALEGNTLTLGETIFFLREGLTSQGKPLKDYLEAKNHAEAIDFLHDVVTGGRELTTGLVKEFNALLLRGVDATLAISRNGKTVAKKAHPGAYKTEPNHVLTLSGKIHHYVEPMQVVGEMDNLMAQYALSLEQNRHPILVAADLHYGIVRIHPFDDCNGRVARVVMNLVLLKHEFPPAIIRTETRKDYLQALEQADDGNHEPFYEIVAGSVLEVLRTCLAEMGQKSSLQK